MARVRQFITDLLAPWLPLDEAFVGRYLSDWEGVLFRRLRRAEMRHAIEVARLTLASLPEDLPTGERCAIARAVLLHDAGKIRHPLGPFGKTAMVLLRKTLERPGSRLARTRAGDIYLNHAEYSCQLLQERDAFPEYPYLYDLIRWHHEPERFLDSYDGAERAVFLAFRQADEAS